MDQNSIVRSVVRYWENGRLRRATRSHRPQLEALEAREVLTATIAGVTPLDGTLLAGNTTSITVTYSENVTGADNAANYVLRDSSGRQIPLSGVTYNPATFQATFTLANINNGAPLPLDTYTLFVRGDQIIDADELVPLAQPNRIVASNSALRDVNVVNVNSNGSLGSPSTLLIDAQGTSNPQPYALASGDLDGDGVDDLVVVNGGTDVANVFFGRSGTQGIGFSSRPDLSLLLPIGALTPIKDVQIADFDNDGKNDIVVMNNFFDSITVFTNIGQGTGSLAFSDPNTFFGLVDPREMAVADFDGDGFKDIAVVNAGTFLGSYNVTLFQNDQNTIANNFLTFRNFSVGTGVSGVQVPVSLTVADFNDDGLLDIAVVGDGLRILFNESIPGSLAFTAGPVISSNSFTSVASLKVDGNSSLDLVAVRDNGDLVTFLNLGTGTFVERATSSTEATGGRLKTGDLDGDGRDELVVTGGTGSNTVSVISTTTRFGIARFLNVSGSVTVESIGHGLVTGDRVAISGVTGQTGLNATFTVTVTGTNTFTLNSYVGTGAAATPGTWALTRTISGASNPTTGPIVISSTGHRLLDGTRVNISGVGGNTAANGTWTVRVLTPNTFELVGSTANAAYTTGGSWVVAGPVGITATGTTLNSPIGLTLLDANLDGFLDIATANTDTNSVTILPGDGERGLVTPEESNLTQANTTAVAYADLNADGILDVVAISTNTANAASRISVMLGNADGTFQDAFDYAPDTSTTFSRLSSVIVADVTGDGKADIIVTGRSTAGNDGVAILRNNITTPTLQANSFVRGPSLRTGDSPTSVVVGDFNEDGIADLAVSHNLAGGVANSTRRGVTYLQGTGGGGFAPGVQIAAAQGFAAAGLVALDYNRDGKLDLAVVDNSTPGQVLLLRGTGSGTFRSAGLFDTGLSLPTDIEAGDFNNDGYTDLVVSSGSTGRSTGGISVLLNDQGTTFRDGIQSTVQSEVPVVNVAVGDLNSDGLLDVVAGTLSALGTSNVFTLFGRGDGTFTDSTPYRTGEISTTGSNTFVALGNTPLLRLTTFKTGGTQVITNLVRNPGFEEAALGGQRGNLTGWQTYKLLSGAGGGSAGGYGPQTGSTSPLSGAGVLRPVDRFQAMLDQPDLLPFFPGNPNPNPANSYSGSHALYQDILIPANATTATLSLRLYLQSAGAWSDPLGNPSLNYTTLAPNQQVRVDIVRPGADPLSIASTDVLLNIFRTASGDATTQLIDLGNINLSAFAGQTIRLRIASANNQGKLIVGVDDVRLTTTLNDTIAPTLSNLRLRTPATNPVGFPITTDPTLLGRVADNAGLGNIAYIEFDPRNAGFQPGTTLRTSEIDASGNFLFSFDNLPLGRYTVGVRVVDRAGNISAVSTFSFEYQNLLTNEWQAMGPTGIRLSDPNLDYSAVTGRITTLETDPSDPSGNTYYVGSANGGVWKTTDGGNSWQPLLTNLVVNGLRVVGAIGAIAVAPSRTQTVYAGLGVADLLHDSREGSGILRSLNGGQTWSVIGNSATVFANARISKIVVDPNNSNIVYVGVASGGQSGPGVYKSTNGGLTWTNIMTPSVMSLAAGGTATGPLASVTDLVIDRFAGNRLLVGLGNVGLTAAPSSTAGLWLSTNGGLSWSQQLGGDAAVANNTLPSGTGVGTVKVAIGQGRSGDQRFVYVFVGTPTGDNTPPNRNLGGFTGLFKSSDNLANFTQVMLRQDTNPGAGANFQDITFGTETSYAASLAIDPNNPNVVFVGGSRKLDSANDLAHSLIRVDTGNMVDANFLSNSGNDILKESFGADEGVYWYDIEQAVSAGTSSNRLLPPTVTNLRFDAQGRLLIGTDGGLWSGTSLGFGYDFSSGGQGILRNTPGPIGGMSLSAINGNLQITSVTSAAADPSQAGRTYATTLTSGQAVTNGPLGFTSQDLLRTPAGFFTPAGTYDAGIIRAGALDPSLPNTAATLYRVWKNDSTGVLRPEISTDNGETWSTVTTNISLTGSEAGYFPVLEVNTRKVNSGGTLFDEVLFGTNRVYGTRSTVWDAISPVFSTTGRITALGIAPVSTTGYYYAGTSEGQLWVAPTGGGTAPGDWIDRSAGLPTGLPITGITVAAGNPNVAFVTVGNRTTGARVFRTNNGGRTWGNVTNNLPAGQVNDILLDNRAALNAPGGKAYAATDSGVFVLVMGTTTWYRVGNLPAAPAVDLSLDPTNNILSAAVQGAGVFNLSVAGISPIADQIIDEDTTLGPIRFTLNTLGVVNPVLNLTAVSSNQAVVRNTGITLAGTGAARSITVRPVANASGETIITLRVSDGVRLFTTSFRITVDPVNDVPTASPIGNVSLSVNQPSNAIPFTVGDVEDPATALVVTATSDNQALIPDGAIVLGGSGANRTVQFTPAVNASGTARITLRVTDSQGGVGLRTFDVVVIDTTALPYTDDFNRADNSFLGAVWTSPVGNFAVVNNSAQSTASLSLSVLSGPVEQDVTLNANLALPARSGQFGALVARYNGVGDRNMYIGGIQATTAGGYNAWIFRNLNGVWTALASRPVSTGTGTITFQVVDKSLKLFLNGSLVAFAFDGALTAGGSVGIRGAGATGLRFDNFDAQVVLGSPPVPPFSEDFSTPVNGQLDPSLWRERSGNFALAGGVATGSAVSMALLNPTFVSTADATVEVDYTLGTGSFAGLVARSDSDGRNYYQASILRTSTGLLATLHRVVNGVGTLLASTAVTSTTGRLTFTLTGTSLDLQLGGTSILSATDSTLTAPGTVGIRSSGAVQFDNFSFSL